VSNKKKTSRTPANRTNWTAIAVAAITSLGTIGAALVTALGGALPG
jgi:hypothetical protein